MSAFREAAYRVLSESAIPMSAEQLTSQAIALGYLVTSGQTPSQTMKSKLSTDILENPESSIFMRTEAGLFGLREWRESGHAEFVAKRYQKKLLAEEILVFQRSILPRFVPRPGLFDVDPSTGAELLSLCVPMQRLEAERNASVIQLVSGFVVQHDGQVLTYMRSKRLPEARLHGEFSALFGGHLNPPDIPVFNIFVAGNEWFMDRELREELRLTPGLYDLQFRGLLFDDSREVSRQHLGIVFDVTLHDRRYTVGERGFLMNDKFETWDEVGNRLAQFENWSQILYQRYRTGT